MFIAVLSTIARTWTQSKYPSTEGWTKTWYIDTEEAQENKVSLVLKKGSQKKHHVLVRW